jgi:peptidoglycan biosynthesis/recognition FemAB-like protein
MNEAARDLRPSPAVAPDGGVGGVEVYSRLELARCRHWKRAFANQRKDHRYYEVVEDTIRQGFDYRYFVIKDEFGEVSAVQPFFLLDQDLLAGVNPKFRGAIAAVRSLWPRFMMTRTLMVGCAAGEGHIDGSNQFAAADNARALASEIRGIAGRLGARLIVLKEFPAVYREPLEPFTDTGFTRIPSLPSARLNIDYKNFDEYMAKALSANMRRNLRKKFKAAGRASPIEMSLVSDIAPIIDDVYRLYLQVYSRSQYQFEKLSKEYFCSLGRRMPDRMRFFVWRQDGSIVAFAMCMVHDDTIYFEYLGLDYRIALDVHLYHNAIRDLLAWAMERGLKWCSTTAVKYDPKYHLRFMLDPLDLYVRHTSDAANAVLKWVLPWFEPTRCDPILKQFPNYGDLWGKPVAADRDRAPDRAADVYPELVEQPFDSLASDRR